MVGPQLVMVLRVVVKTVEVLCKVVTKVVGDAGAEGVTAGAEGLVAAAGLVAGAEGDTAGAEELVAAAGLEAGAEGLEAGAEGETGGAGMVDSGDTELCAAGGVCVMVAVTGQIVVLIAIVSVVTTMPELWPAGQLVTVGAQLVMVWTVVVKMVEVLW
jgi:hypothetical protein